MVGSQRVVVTIDDGDSAGLKNWRHRTSLGGSETDGDEALPVAAGQSAAGPQPIEGSGGQVNELEDGSLVHNGGVKRSSVRDQRHNGILFRVMFRRRTNRLRQKVFDAEQLCGENAIESRKAQLALAVNEIRKMRRAEAGLEGEKRTGKLAAFDAAGYFDAKPLVKLRKIHLWNFVFELHTLIKQFADCKAI